MPKVIINGKQTYMPDSQTTVTREDIIRASGKKGVDPNSRAVVMVKTGHNTRMKPGQSYSVDSDTKFKVVPDRVKAAGEYTFFGNKEAWRKQLIEEQVIDVSKKFFKSSPVELDDNCNWVKFDRFLLPKEWQKANPGVSFVPMMLIFPDQYPELPTNGFYLPASLQTPPNASHFFNRGYGGAFGMTAEEMQAMAQGNWNWYCTHIKPDAWNPARIRKISDWRLGDNLWDILTICTDVLTYPLDD